MADGVRVDKWLWATRLFKTRSASAGACEAGRVRIDDVVVKAAKRVKPGDTVTIRRRHHDTVVVVRQLREKRGSAAAVADDYDDISPPRPTSASAPVADAGTRDAGSGRPTKRDRRQIDKLRGRE
ncbi:MAG: S4 domain-containing protein [Acidimicrobiia bacterium]|nr:S4 domain-containing protein [Acidimicrobiia bacterium]